MPEKWNIHPGKGTWLTCYVWDGFGEMRAYLVGKEPDFWGDTVACYLGCGWRFTGDGDLISRKLGELHFVNGEFGAGIFAHELQHFLTNWVVLLEWEKDLLKERFEEIAYLAGDLTREFWECFYKRFAVEPGEAK